ncbi:MAG: hypothetical protein KIS86_16685 [Devosia sp.]|nr:hypothetical protein [Devosia sp.]
MLDFLEHIPPDWRPFALFVFIIVGAGGAALSYLRGKKVGPETKVQESAVFGQLADMGPVKELIEQTGLLMQQQVRTNIHLEAVAVALKRFADAYEHRIEDEQREKEIEEEVQRRLAKSRER